MIRTFKRKKNVIDIALFISEISIVGGKGSATSKNLHEIMDELGYMITSPAKADVIIVIGSTESAIRYFNKLNRKKKRVLISVSEDGSYVIPLVGETRGGSLLGSLISDLLSAELVLTSFFSQNVLSTLDEFLWVNALKMVNPEAKSIINKTLRKERRVKVLLDYKCMELKTDEGFEIVKKLDEADIVVTRDHEKYIDMNKAILTPREILFPIWFTNSTPLETIIYSIFTTMKSIFLFEKRVDKLFVPQYTNADFLDGINHVLRTDVCKLDIEMYTTDENDYMQLCSHIISRNGGKMLLKPKRRAMGVITCLGIK